MQNINHISVLVSSTFVQAVKVGLGVKTPVYTSLFITCPNFTRLYMRLSFRSMTQIQVWF